MEQSPKEKADSLVSDFQSIEQPAGWDQLSETTAIECAKMNVDNIIKAIDWHEFETPNKELEFWVEVKQELEKM